MHRTAATRASVWVRKPKKVNESPENVGSQSHSLRQTVRAQGLRTQREAEGFTRLGRTNLGQFAYGQRGVCRPVICPWAVPRGCKCRRQAKALGVKPDWRDADDR